MAKFEDSIAFYRYEKVSLENNEPSDTSYEVDFKDENFSDIDTKTFGELFCDRTFLDEKRNFQKDFIEAVKNCDIEEFFYSFADKTFKKYHYKYNIAAIEWLNDLLLKNLNKPDIVCGVLKVLSNIEYLEVQSFGYAMIMMAIYEYDNDKNLEVLDLAISCIENWEDPAFITLLNQLHTKTNFIELYKRKVSKYLAA